MDEERERGRIASLRVRREKKVERARRMVPVLALARMEIGEGCTYEKLAEWLTLRRYARENGEPWTKQSLWEFCQVEGTSIALAEEEYGIEQEVIRYKKISLGHISHDEARELASESRLGLRRAIAEARVLGKALRGEGRGLR